MGLASGMLANAGVSELAETPNLAASYCPGCAPERDPIEEILPSGLRTKSAVRELDCIVFATGFDAMTGALLMKSRLQHIKKLADYTEYGGAPLLGVNGIVIISHGRSSPKAIKNAIRATIREVDHNIIAAMAKELSE